MECRKWENLVQNSSEGRSQDNCSTSPESSPSRLKQEELPGRRLYGKVELAYLIIWKMLLDFLTV